MSDTIQNVRWALAKKCPLRQQDGWENPGTAFSALADYRTYSCVRRHHGFGVFDNVCLTYGSQSRADETTRYYDYPRSGFIIPQQIAQSGGLPALHQLCGNCPANTDKDGLAGCIGRLNEGFYSKEGREQLDRLISQLGIGLKLDASFPQTRLHWYRFWINSPIPPEACLLLRQLFGAVFEERLQILKKDGRNDLGRFADLKTFLDALDLSIAGHIPLHVNLTPPGHADFGRLTIFPHCPRCKLEAPLERWKRKYPETEIKCQMCGAKYSPARTFSSVREEFDADDLRKILDPATFEKIAFQSLRAQGASDTDAAKLVQMEESKHRERLKELAQRRKLFQRHQNFLEKVIYHGLQNLSSGNEEEPWSFSAEDMEEILRRIRHHGGKVYYLRHPSESDDYDKLIQVKAPTSAEAVLQGLRAQAHYKKFSIHLKIPDEVVDQWLNSLPT